MTETDPLFRLLQTADSAAAAPGTVGDLPNRVRQRRAAQVARMRRIKLGSLAGVAIVLVAIAIQSWKSPAELGVSPLASDDIARLRADADALGAEADALAGQIASLRGQQTRQQLRDEHQSHLAAQLDQYSMPDSLDRAALVGLSQGDFYRDVRQSTGEARAAYESVIEHFPDSHWAAIAQTRVSQLQMN